MSNRSALGVEQSLLWESLAGATGEPLGSLQVTSSILQVTSSILQVTSSILQVTSSLLRDWRMAG